MVNIWNIPSIYFSNLNTIFKICYFTFYVSHKSITKY